MNKNIQMITLKHEPQPLKRRSITAPSPLKIHPNNPPATKKKIIKTMIPIIPNISITYYLFVSWHNIVTFREKFKKRRNYFRIKLNILVPLYYRLEVSSDLEPQDPDY